MVPPTPDPLPGPSPVTFCTCEIYGVFYMAAACLEGRGGEVWGRHRSNPGIWGPPHAGVLSPWVGGTCTYRDQTLKQVLWQCY